MKKMAIYGAAVIGGVLLARRYARSCGSFSFEKLVERMPEDAPPKWMFRNVSEIHENTERILELLEKGQAPAAAEQTSAAA